MIGGKVLNHRRYIKRHKPGSDPYLSVHRYTIPTQVQRKRARKKRRKGLDEYQKTIVRRLAVHYDGETLDEKLAELEFCTIEQAREILSHAV